MAPSASVIVRAKNEARSIERCLQLLRRQSVRAEIIVVDSGSSDATADIARRYCDRLIEIAPEQFSYGRALNIGAEAASAPIHFAVSAHCFVEREDWIARSLRHYADDRVAGTQGIRALPDGSRLGEVLYQDERFARAHPEWGFSNHASSWRGSVWERFRFDEQLDFAEDKEWALRVLGAGFVIAVDPELWVDLSHQWRSGTLDFYRRQKRAARALASFAGAQPHGPRALIREWWREPPDKRWPRSVYRVHPKRLAGMIGKYAGRAAAARKARRNAR